MNLLWLSNNSPSVLGNTDRGERLTQTPSSMDKGGAETARDLAWQQAMEHAQQGELPDWFKAFLPNDPTVVRNTQGTVGILLASPFASAHLAPTSPSGTSTQFAPHESTALTGNSNRIDSTTVSGESRAGEENSHPAQPGSASGNIRKSSSSDRGIWSEVGYSNPGNDSQSVAGGISQTLSSSFVDALSAKLGFTIVQESSLEDITSLSGAGALLANTSSEFSATAASDSNESILQSDAETGPHKLPEPSSMEPSATGLTSTETLREPLRMYSEWTNQGVRIWLGADANQNLPLAQLTQQVQQWLADQGERLVTLVCNGRLLWHMDGGDISPSVNSPALSHQSKPEFPKLNLLSTLSQPNQEIQWQSAQ